MTRRPAQAAFVAMMAMLFATIALSIDAMLPALPAIAAELTPDDTNRALLIISSFFLGMGLGTFVAGPASDALGRKPVIFACATIYAVATVLCWFAPSLELLLFARIVQGLGAAAPRVVGMAMVRDLYKGRDMARIVSLVMMIFMIVPALAPLLGQGILLFGNWRTIFAALLVFTVIANAWVLLGQPETLAPEARRPFRAGHLWQSAVEMSRHRIALISTLCQGFGSACLLSTVSSQQAIFAETFGRIETFPLWFGFIALCAASGSLLNSRIVMRMGMRRVIITTYIGEVALTLAILALDATGLMPDVLAFPVHVFWSITVFAMMGLTQGNLTALAMEDLGHIAGFAASMITAISTVMASLLAAPVGLAFNGTQIPLMVAVAVYSSLALGLVGSHSARKV
ncbi:multidrug effflux MFS transporter [Tabrizicola sp.]|jgi:DHA1 family bicyclomycin/chloramphenicol resistance-like MFS transporter|uniref:multidrug effflux MFS transporter n=1 Tax=Tabrizicola sp. TaxID=2005166 RepID=UPI001A5FD677|nr:multidrug effflux MFS transporter [Tabrizicola sp.]MBL9063961.1 multidrug effflux MFS transporter [Tabrizicola sp.]